MAITLWLASLFMTTLFSGVASALGPIWRVLLVGVYGDEWHMAHLHNPP